MKIAKVLDCKNMICPEPILNIKMAMTEVNSGDIIEMQATDKGSVSDMASWSHRTGHEVIDQKEEDGVFFYFVKKK